MESTKRSLVKTLSWEFVHLVIIAGVIYLITGKWEYATLGALVYIAWEALAYFIHERIWAKFVRIKQPWLARKDPQLSLLPGG